MGHQLKLSFEELNQIKLITIIEMSEELQKLHKEENKVIGNPNDFKF